MAEEIQKKKEGAIGETPDIEKPPALSPETSDEKMEKTPPTPPSPALESPPDNPTRKPPCQWFMDGSDYCEKIKKSVRCGGDVSRCPF
ncbi:MAG: hypothetical protein GTN38_02705 [Candidatus Aenigmarchaeota archaeon]|nr:hypothetical protein [Candidatus Aenigmarchaeota archaeon]NIP40547.1 hypothetical protein [Candidatus Aenigmarchaeota archaeon]NIQ18392.1 hypothetical protein [Candidatus Aenigmarchaeota archaeon]